MRHLSLTLKMTSEQVVESSVSVNNNSPVQDYFHPDDHTQPTHEMTPGFKLFTISVMFVLVQISMQMLLGIDFQLRVT